MRLTLLALGGAAFLAVPGSPALAGYPPALQLCADLAGESGQNGGRLVLTVGGAFRVEGGQGCANPGSPGHVDGQSHRFTFTDSSFVVRADGSYSSPTLQVPAHMTPGPHSLFAVFPEGEVVLPILVVGDGGGGGLTDTNDTSGSPTNSNNSAGGGGGLAATNRTAAGGGGGILPKTGAGILTLVLWAIALIATGSWLVIAARRRLEWQRLQAAGGRPRSRDRYPLALPMPEVPFLDTRGFSHVRPAVPPPAPKDAEL